ncbi:MAG: nucleotidyl transferase AbiEii/AbiGii toxin family protein [Endomicrobia bacterium]|nr:nucleotidyl transferase AbiEii/AbiGii toxin family protein [Endomicrobiia bacterium]
MLHNDKEEFIKLINSTAMHTGFLPIKLEKDYYLTLVLSKIQNLSPNLVFKGGTCLNKIYFDYHRLSEDLDFSLEFRQPTKPERKAGISPRKVVLKKIENDMSAFAEQFQLKFIELTKRDGSRQHNYQLGFISAATQKEETIKFEIRARENSIISNPIIKEASHKFIHQFTQKPLIPFPKVKVYPLKELLADKLAACINRYAPRDFYDIIAAIDNKFNFADADFINLFKAKLQDDGNDTDIKKYVNNLGLPQEVINSVKEKISSELYPVLSLSEQKNFNFPDILNKINSTIEKMLNVFNINR